MTETTPRNTFVVQQPIRFADCDPAGVMYFPRLLEMVNNLTEDWFEQLGLPFEEMHLRRRLGVPVVNTRLDFLRACRLGEKLALELAIARLGRSSVEFAISGTVGGQERLRARHRIAMMSLDSYRAVALPGDLRERMAAYSREPQAEQAPPATHDGRVPQNAFRTRHLVRFSHCDPAGIVFYPRFFDLFVSVLEDWFQTGLACPWGGEFMVERNLRVPSISIGVEFLRGCRLGEFLDFDLWVTRLGGSSIELALAGSVNGEQRLRVTWRVCIIDHASFKSIAIPDDLRARMARFASPGC